MFALYREYYNDILKSKGLEEDIKEPRKPYSFPTVKPLPLGVGLAIFSGMAIIGASIGAVIGTYIFFGCATLAGFIAIAESNKYVKWIVVHSTQWIDLLIFAATMIATVSLGVTVTAALTFAGLGYTLVYAPYVRIRENN
jgi:hypothetical protein